MELPEDTRPLLASFTSPRNVTIVSEDGSQCVIFEAGESKKISRRLFNVALTSGLVPDESLDAAPVMPENKTRGETVSEGLLGACKTLIARGLDKDFTMVGQPRAASLKKLVNFDFTGREAQSAFELAMHEIEVEQNGDNSPKHPEQSVIAAQ